MADQKIRTTVWRQRCFGAVLAIGAMGLIAGTQAAHGDIIVDENFDALADGAVPAGPGWTSFSNPPNSTIGAQSAIKAGASGKAILLDEIAANSFPQLYYEFTAPGAEATQLTVEFDAYNVAGGNGSVRSYFYLGSTSTGSTEVTTELYNSSFYVTDSASRRVVKSTQTRGVWNNLRYEVDLANSTYDFFVNDELVVDDSGFSANGDGVIDKIRWLTDVASDGALVIDNVSITTVVPEPASIGLISAGILLMMKRRNK